MTEHDRYSRGKIYKLVSDMTDAIYIGSCCVPLRKRLSIHKSTFKRGVKATKSVELFKLGGKVEIILIEDYPCKSKMELERRERFHIENNNCVNRYIPGRTYNEWREANREIIAEKKKVYYESNREEILNKQKEYYESNREVKLEKQKEYREANRELLKQKQKEYGSTRINCPHCSKELRRDSIPKHIKSQHSTKV